MAVSFRLLQFFILAWSCLWSASRVQAAEPDLPLLVPPSISSPGRDGDGGDFDALTALNFPAASAKILPPLDLGQIL